VVSGLKKYLNKDQDLTTAELLLAYYRQTTDLVLLENNIEQEQSQIVQNVEPDINKKDGKLKIEDKDIFLDSFRNNDYEKDLDYIMNKGEMLKDFSNTVNIDNLENDIKLNLIDELQRDTSILLVFEINRDDSIFAFSTKIENSIKNILDGKDNELLFSTVINDNIDENNIGYRFGWYSNFCFAE